MLALVFALIPTVTLAFVGDVSFGRRIGKQEMNPLLRNGRFPLARADWAFANLECALSMRPFSARKVALLKALPAKAKWLKEGGIDCVSLANNHASDCGPEGLEDTVRALNGVSHAGYEPVPLLQKVNGIRLGVLAYTDFPRDAAEGVSIADPERVKGDITALRRRADIIVVSFHWGVENTAIVTPRQKLLARSASEADIIVGHGPHRVQQVGKIGKAIVAYSLGDYVFDRKGERVRWEVSIKNGQVTQTKLLHERNSKIERPSNHPELSPGFGGRKNRYEAALGYK